MCVISKISQPEMATAHAKVLALIAQAKTNAKGCMLTHVVPNKAGGYSQVTYKKGHKVLIHHVAYWRIKRNKTSGADVLAAMKPGCDISHRCGNSNCINPNHLVQETSQKNQQRKGCPGDLVCACGTQVYTCPHSTNPNKKCI